jgi:hypothetical protein
MMAGVEHESRDDGVRPQESILRTPIGDGEGQGQCSGVGEGNLCLSIESAHAIKDGAIKVHAALLGWAWGWGMWRVRGSAGRAHCPWH